MRVQPTYTCRFLDEDHNELTIEQAKEIIAQDELAGFHAMQVYKKLNEMDEEERATIYNYLVGDEYLMSKQPSFVQSNTL